MLVIFSAIARVLHNAKFQRAKPFTLHCSLLLLVLVYAFAGGFIFNKLEADAYRKHQVTERTQRLECVHRTLSSMTNYASSEFSKNMTAESILRCFATERDERSEWSFVTATLYGFGIVTTLGYNRIAPITYAGRLFCIVYGICGIPITMIIIANVGQYLNNFAGDSRRKLEAYRTQRRMSKASLSGKEYKEASIEVTSLVLLAVFLLYVALGALLLPALNGQIDFFNGLYYNFLCLTAIDFGQLVPSRVALLPITFLYVCLGLAITTIAIDIGSEYMKKLHYLGKKMKDAASTKIWFGGKTLKVRDLLHAVGKKCGVEPHMIDALDLENVVERTIALREGRTPPEDTNDDPPREPSPSIRSTCKSPPPSAPGSPGEGSPFIRAPPCPDFIIRKPVYQTTSNDLPVYSPVVPEKIEFPPAQTCKLESPKPISEREESHIMIIEPPAMLEDILPIVQSTSQFFESRKSSSDSATRSRSISPDTDGAQEKVPKKFREKKERYARDPRKLYETYQEEWDRLERLSDRKFSRLTFQGLRLGHRRRSILNLPGSPDRSPSPNPRV